MPGGAQTVPEAPRPPARSPDLRHPGTTRLRKYPRPRGTETIGEPTEMPGSAVQTVPKAALPGGVLGSGKGSPQSSNDTGNQSQVLPAAPGRDLPQALPYTD